jgi:hypothetical protein
MEQGNGQERERERAVSGGCKRWLQKKTKKGKGKKDVAPALYKLSRRVPCVAELLTTYIWDAPRLTRLP